MTRPARVLLLSLAASAGARAGVRRWGGWMPDPGHALIPLRDRSPEEILGGLAAARIGVRGSRVVDLPAANRLSSYHA